MTFYRGFDSTFGFDTSDSFIWISDDFDYASEYGDCVKSVEINFDTLHFADLYTLETTCNKLDYDYLDAIYNPTEEIAEELRKCGFNAYTIEPMDYKCCCLLDKNLIIDIQIGGNNEISLNLKNPEREQSVFLQSLARSQRANPFVKVLNDNIPLILLLQTIQLINADPTCGNGAGISRKEIPILLFWKDNDAASLYVRIKDLREKFGFNPSDEVIIDICINEIMQGKYKKFDPHSIMNDYVDEFIRKMRMSSLVSLRGAGRFIDINHNEDKKVAYILENYSDYERFDDEHNYFEYMSHIDKNLIAQKAETVSDEKTNDLLSEWVKAYAWEAIKNELHILATHKTTKDDVLKFLAAPVRLEFLTALAIKSKLPAVIVKPNYSCDDTGLPTSTAGGNKGDIECFENGNGILVEVTMAEGRTQTMMEVWPIERHLQSFIAENDIPCQCIFIAPTIYADSKRQIAFVKFTNNLTIRDYAIDEMTEYLEKETRLYAENA